MNAPELRPALPEVAARFAARFDKDRPRAGDGALLAQEHALGPGAVARCVRRALGSRSAADRVAEIGFRLKLGAARPCAPRVLVDASAAGAIVCAAITTRCAAGERTTVGVAGGAVANLELSRHALQPLIERGEVDLEIVGGGESWPSALTVGGDARASVVIAPYYFATGDLDRLARQLALELMVPCPHSEGGLEILVARGWEQRDVFQGRLDALLAAHGLGPATVTLLEAADALETLQIAGASTRVPAATAAFVYPMWRERPEVERALVALVSRSQLGVINHRPSAAWQLGVGVPMRDVLIDVDQQIRTTSRARLARLVERYDARPSLGRALAVTLTNYFSG